MALDHAAGATEPLNRTRPGAGHLARPADADLPGLVLAWSLFFAGGLLATEAAAELPQPLFESDDPLAVTLEIPMRAMARSVRSDEPFAGRLTYGNGSDSRVFNLQIEVRGHSRRELCDMPPLKLDFRRGEVEGTVFEGQNKLKLVTHCLDRFRNRRYLEQEYATYRALNALTEHSFRVRLLAIRYVDTEKRQRSADRHAFLIEDDSRLAGRLGYRESALAMAPTGSLDPDAITLFGLFQFMIGNTDWSLIKGRDNGTCCHNGLLLETPDKLLVIVPYDFDQAGIIDADYALPAEGLGIRSVRDRLFRGLCTGEERLDAAIALFIERRGAIEQAFAAAGESARQNARSGRYLDDFYAIINDDEARAGLIESRCRGEPSFWDWIDRDGNRDREPE